MYKILYVQKQSWKMSVLRVNGRSLSIAATSLGKKKEAVLVSLGFCLYWLEHAAVRESGKKKMVQIFLISSFALQTVVTFNSLYSTCRFFLNVEKKNCYSQGIWATRISSCHGFFPSLLRGSFKASSHTVSLSGLTSSDLLVHSADHMAEWFKGKGAADQVYSMYYAEARMLNIWAQRALRCMLYQHISTLMTFLVGRFRKVTSGNLP